MNERLAVSLTIDPSTGDRDISPGRSRPRHSAAPDDGSQRGALGGLDVRWAAGDLHLARLDLYRRAADFSGGDEALVVDGTSKDPRDVSFDGARLLYRRSGAATSNDIWVMPLLGDRTPRPLLQTPADENYASFSPDARSMVFVSDESGVSEVYVMSLEPGGGKVQVSTQGGSFPRWRNPNEIVYVAPDQTLMSVAVTGAGATFAAGVPSPAVQY